MKAIESIKIFLILMLISQHGIASDQVAISESDSKPSVSVEIEIKGLEEVTSNTSQTMKTLNNSIQNLDKIITEIYTSPEKLTPEQLEYLKALIEATDSMMISATQTIITAEAAIESLEIPANRIIDEAINETNSKLIQPYVEKALTEIAVWRFSLIGLVTLLAILLTYLIITSRNLVELISGQYRLVHISRLPSEEAHRQERQGHHLDTTNNE